MNKRGKIIKIISNLYTVSSNGQNYECRARGRFRNDKLTPLVGEFVVFDDESAYILEIDNRKNELKRPPIVNVDVAIIVTSVKAPDLSLSLLDKELLCVLKENIEPIICLTKWDLLTFKEKCELKKIFKYYKKIGFKVIKNRNLFTLKRLVKNKTVVLTGQTGSGKSTLLNKLDPKLSLSTSPISKALGRGVHTTRHVELFPIGKSLIADTPGFSALDITIAKDEIKNYFPEFKDAHCKFENCNHENERDCSVKNDYKIGKILASRYENYIKFRGEK